MNAPAWAVIDGHQVSAEEMKSWRELPTTKAMYALLNERQEVASNRFETPELPEQQLHFYRGELAGIKRFVLLYDFAVKQLSQKEKQSKEIENV